MKNGLIDREKGGIEELGRGMMALEKIMGVA
jgi:hypothetical protein